MTPPQGGKSAGLEVATTVPYMNPLLACLRKLVVTFAKIKGRPRLS